MGKIAMKQQKDFDFCRSPINLNCRLGDGRIEIPYGLLVALNCKIKLEYDQYLYGKVPSITGYRLLIYVAICT
jgi:hypothetical protein